MSEIPFLERLGDAFDEALHTRPPSRRPPATVAFALGFLVVMAAGSLLWLVRPSTEQPAQPTTTTAAIVEPEALPTEFARVPATPMLEDGSRMFLSSVVVANGEFVAVGGGDSGGIVLASLDGVTWERRLAPPAGSSLDTAIVHGERLVVGGVDVAQGPGAWENDEAGWQRLALPASGYGVGFVRDFAVVDRGLVAVGQGVSGDGTQTAIVWLESDVGWTRIVDGSFTGRGQIDANGAATDGEGLVVAGVWSNEPDGAAAVVWTSDDLATWRRIALPDLGDVVGQSWATDVAWTGERYVAFGGAMLPAGRTAVVWTSPDGVEWQRTPHDPTILDGGGSGTLNLASVEPVAGGVLGLGAMNDGAAFTGLVFTSPDGVTWRRLELSGSNPLAALPAAAAERGDVIVLVGGEAPATASPAFGAAWVSPPPPWLAAAGPPSTTADTVGTHLVLVPDVATPGSRVAVSIDFGEIAFPDGEATILVAGRGGEVEACRIPFARGFVPRCYFRPEDVGVTTPGDVTVVARLGEAALAETSLEIAPSGTVVARLGVVYTARLDPLVQTALVRNLGDAPLDISGWTIDSVRRTDPWVLPGGTVLDPLESAGLIAGYGGQQSCGQMSGRNLIVCPSFGTGPDDPNISPGMEVYAAGIVLLDAAGNEVDTWSP